MSKKVRNNVPKNTSNNFSQYLYPIIVPILTSMVLGAAAWFFGSLQLPYIVNELKKESTSQQKQITNLQNNLTLLEGIIIWKLGINLQALRNISKQRGIDSSKILFSITNKTIPEARYYLEQQQFSPDEVNAIYCPSVITKGNCRTNYRATLS